jgi:prophage regulatory protein
MILTKKQVVERTSLSPSTIWRRMQIADFPMSVQLSPGKIGWHEEEIDLWLESRPRGIAELPENLKTSSLINNPVERGDTHEK